MKRPDFRPKDKTIVITNQQTLDGYNPRNYVQALEFLKEQGLIGDSVYDTEIQHDNWCHMLNGKADCNCNPTIVLTDLKNSGAPVITVEVDAGAPNPN